MIANTLNAKMIAENKGGKLTDRIVVGGLGELHATVRGAVFETFCFC